MADIITESLILLVDNGILKYLGSFLIGAIGSLAYILAVFFGFAGGRTEIDRRIVLKPFFTGGWYYRSVKLFLYCFCGGFLALVFQLCTTTFVPIQSLIMGISWPIFISTILSGRQSEINPEEKPSKGVMEKMGIKKEKALPEEYRKSFKDSKRKYTKYSWR